MDVLQLLKVGAIIVAVPVILSALLTVGVYNSFRKRETAQRWFGKGQVTLWTFFTSFLRPGFYLFVYRTIKEARSPERRPLKVGQQCTDCELFTLDGKKTILLSELLKTPLRVVLNFGSYT
jgi:hypothetical protein